MMTYLAYMMSSMARVASGVFILFSLPISGQGWLPVAPLPDGFVSNHSFGFALDGKGYLVVGESTDGYSAAFYEYDPTADAWMGLMDFPGPARGYAIGDTWDGKAWMGFGASNDGYLNDLWVFDPDSMTWTEKASCPCEPRTHPAFVAEGGKILMGLGGSVDGDLGDWWEYDIATDSWSQKPDFPSIGRHHPYQFGIDGMVYVGFGHRGGQIFNDWYGYDPMTEEWTELSDLPAEGRVAGTQLAMGGMGFALSGDGEDHSSMETGEMWKYDPGQDGWELWPVHPGMSRWAPASFVLENEIYLINGMSMDPGSFDFMTTNWKLPAVPELADDVAVVAYLGETEVCSGEGIPITLRFMNLGADTLMAGNAQALTFQMEVDGEVVLSSDWSGILPTYSSVEFTLGEYVFSESSEVLLRVLSEDGDLTNNAMVVQVDVTVEATSLWAVELLTDNWGDEVGWELRDSDGEVVESAAPGSYANETLYTFELSLPATDCYSFTLIDTYGDGMNGSMWGGSDGYCLIQSLDVDGEPAGEILSYDGSFGYDVYTVSADVTTLVSAVERHEQVQWGAYPNPLGDVLHLTGLPVGSRWEVLDAQGRKVDAGIVSEGERVWSVDVSHWPPGVLMLLVDIHPTTPTAPMTLRLVR